LLFIGLDDTDTLASRGTGHLARRIAAVLAANYSMLGVTRHQLLVDPRVPYTAKNSSVAIVLQTSRCFEANGLATHVQALVREYFNPGSDPGLCIGSRVPGAITTFGRRVQQGVVTQEEARTLAAAHGIPLIGLGGTEDGVIGALAAVGLAAGGDDGRYVMVGRMRELSGLQSVDAVLAAGVADVRTVDGRPVTKGLILTDKLRPARRGAEPIAVVEWSPGLGEGACPQTGEGACPEPGEGWSSGYWRPLKLD
jgi:hypothetical protein